MLLFLAPALAFAGTLAGKVTDSNNAAIGSVAIHLQQGGTTVASTASATDGTYSVTAADGTYTVIALPPSGSGFTNASLPNRVISGATSLDLVLVKAAVFYTVTGTVVTSTGAPLSGATVRVFGTPSDRTTTSAADGTFTVTDVEAGTYTVRASKSGYGTKDATGFVVDGDETTTITLLADVTFSGTILDSKGRPLPGPGLIQSPQPQACPAGHAFVRPL